MMLDVHGEEALDLFAELLEPAAEIMADAEVTKAARAGKRIPAIKAAVKGHKKAVIAILSAINGEDPEEYAQKMTLFTLPSEAIRLLNDPMVQSLFQSQGQTRDKGSSGSATDSIEESEN